MLKAGLLAGFIALLVTPVAAADMGIVPPANTSVYEPGQKAIVAWNGERETLILSTDVRASENSWAVELIPLPSRPASPEAGSFNSFVEVQNLLESRMRSRYFEKGLSMPAGERVEIIFEKEIGVHHITGIKAGDSSELIDLAEDTLGRKAPDQEVSWTRLENLASEYLDRNLNYWVLDLIELGNFEKSRQPIVYSFESYYLYFPLEISSLALGDTEISLYTLTENQLDENSVRESGLQVGSFSIGGEEKPMEFVVTQPELTRISSEAADLFDDNARLTVLKYEGRLENLEGDLMVDHVVLEKAQGGVSGLYGLVWAMILIFGALGIFAVIHKFG